MTADDSSTDAAPPYAVGLKDVDATGAQAFGAIVSLDGLRSRADLMARTADARDGLMLRLCGRKAILWSARAASLPRLLQGVRYLGRPSRRIYAPLGVALDAPPLLITAWLAALERRFDLTPPFVAAPAALLDRRGDRMALVDLRRSLPVAAVDWRRLASGTDGA